MTPADVRDTSVSSVLSNIDLFVERLKLFFVLFCSQVVSLVECYLVCWA